MTTTKRLLPVLTGLLMALAPAVAGDPPAKLPPGHPAIGGARPFQVPPPAPGAGVGERALVWDVPDGWIVEPPANPMRRAQYRIRGAGGDAQCVVFYFGPGQGGAPMANARRWAGQFQAEEGHGGPEGMKTETRRVGDVEVLLVEVRGRYLGGAMMGGAAEPKAHYMLLGAIAQGPDANWFFKLTGPAATVEAQREAFLGLIASLRPGSKDGRRPT